MAVKQSVQMWDNKKLTVLEGEPIRIGAAQPPYNFICVNESPGLFSIVCVQCGLRVCYGDTPYKALKKCQDIFTQYNKHGQLQDYLRETVAAYHAYLAYVWARAGMSAHSPAQILSIPRFPLFNHHHLEDV